MKFEKNPKYTTIAIYAFAVIAASILFLELLRNVGNVTQWLGRLAGYVTPVTYGFIIAFLLNPMLRLFDDRLLPKLGGKTLKPKAKRAIAIALTYLVSFIFFAILIAIVVPQLIESLSIVAKNVPTYLKQLNTLYEDLTVQFRILQHGEETDELLQNLTGTLMTTLESFLESMTDFLKGMVNYVVSFTARFTTGLLNIILGVIISIYFLNDREKLFAQAKKISRALLPAKIHDLLYEIAKETNRVFSGFIVGKIIDSVIIGILCFIFMCILNPTYAMLIGVIIGVTNVIPYFGPFIGAIPSFFLLLISEGPLQGFIFLVFILILQQFDGNILGPKILGDSTGLSALWVIFAIMLFGGAMGPIGMFVGVPLFALVYHLGKRLFAYLLQRKGLSPNTRDYASDKNPLIK